MKSILYIFLISLSFSLSISAQPFPLDEKYSSFIVEEWTDGQWINSIKMSNTFDSSGNKIKDGVEAWNDTTKVWESQLINYHTLNANSTINFTIAQMWNKETNSWQDFQKTVYTYDDAKNILTQKMQLFFGIDWMDMSMTTNFYNASGQLTKSVNQNSNFLTSQLVNSSQETYSYNADGTQNQNIYQNWNIVTNTWENDSRSTNTYNDAKNITSILDESFTLGAWINDTKTTISYNADRSLKESLNQNWDALAGKWVDTDKESYTNNPNGTFSQVLTSKWMTATSTWQNQSRATATYSLTSIGQQLAGTDQLKVFPNPFNDVISIESGSMKVSSFQIYNTNGQLVRTIAKGETLSSVDLSTLKRGVYLLKVNSPESQKVIKLLKNE